ncbi:exonuclease domain-containing protein [Niveibacterium terrae]|uniref:exonuclease domain-containing protein n=1 Tax=Niveibacterium terrae TaxID=3373598 RepID=UPI003A8E456C
MILSAPPTTDPSLLAASPLFERPLVIVDLETTGADPNRDRITEIAIVRIEGGRCVDSWSSLVDPEMPIPARIQAFTHISNEMVAGAPNFRALADEVAERLAGAIFVAHNARFDFNFLRAAFAERGVRFDPPVLCTVKFSRALAPHLPRHGLDAIIARQGYEVEDRHRALTDAELVWRFLQDAVAEHATERIVAAMERASSAAAAIPVLPQGDLEALPEAPGVYLFLNGEDGLLQVGHTAHLRSKVLGTFTGRSDPRSAKLAAQVKRVEAVVAAGELDAQLIEHRLARRYAPDKYPNRALGWRWLTDADASPVLSLEELAGSDPSEWGRCFGAFRGEREAENALRELALLHRLCPQRVGLEFGEGPCQAHGLRRCNGVCAGQENAAEHDARLAVALVPLKMRLWPWEGPVAIREVFEPSGHAATHVFDRWCLLGSAHDEAEAAELLSLEAPRRFDLDVFRLFARWLAQPGNTAKVHVL